MNWTFFGLYVLTGVVILLLILLVLFLRALLVEVEATYIPNIAMQPERCASCSRVLPQETESVEFTRVPVDWLMGGTLYVHFRVCQSCAAVGYLA